MHKVFLLLICAVNIENSLSVKILGLFPMNAYSHHVQGKVILSELAKRGHEVTFVSPIKENVDLQNFRQIHIDNFGVNVDNKRFFDYYSEPTLTQAVEINQLGLRFTKYILEYPKVKDLINSNETFDLIIMDMFLNEAFFGFAHRFKCNTVLISTLVTNVWTNHIMANDAPPSFVPSFNTNYTSEMTFLERLNNFRIVVGETFYRKLVILPEQNRILHEHFPSAPHLYDLMYNSSNLMLVNTHISINDPVPLMPNMIEIGGSHITNSDPLTPDLKQFLDSAENGVVYFSMGSNLKSNDFNLKTKNVLLRAFGMLKQKVLWKFEDDMEGKPHNIRIEKWLPQQAVLNHPNVKVFISHGGLMSTIEAVYFGVPIIGIPIFADQKMNIGIARKRGYALCLPMSEINEKMIVEAVEELIENPKYNENISKRSDIMKDRLVKPLDTAIYWIEYVIRHNGAYHYQTAALKLNWFSYYSVDLILTIAAGIYIIVLFCRMILSYIICILTCGSRQMSQKQKLKIK